jgi:clan AA aspartic protease
VNGKVDRSGRALIALQVRPTQTAESTELTAWVETAFTGDLVIPRSMINQLQLPQSSAVMAGLADGTEVVLDTFSCVVEWFDEERNIEALESAGEFPLLGIGLLQGSKLEVDYRSRTVVIA